MSSSPKSHTAIGILNQSRKLTSFPLPTPSPGPGDILIKSLYIGHTPLSQWQVDFALLGRDVKVISGNVVGEVVGAGEGVEGIEVGEMVMCFTMGDVPACPTQEFVLVKPNHASKIPSGLTPQQAVTMPDSFVAAYHTIATELGLPLPTMLPADPPAQRDIPILVWGGSSSVGSFSLQVLRAAGYTNIIVTASERSFPSLRPFTSNLISYASLPEAISQIKSLLKPDEPVMVIDCIGDQSNTVEPIAEVVRGRVGSKVAVMLPVRVGGYGGTERVEMEVKLDFGQGVEVLGVRTHFYEKNEAVKDTLQPVIMPTWINQGYIKPMIVREIEGETFLGRCERALQEIREGKVRGEKLVTRVW